MSFSNLMWHEEWNPFNKQEIVPYIGFYENQSKSSKNVKNNISKLVKAWLNKDQRGFEFLKTNVTFAWFHREIIQANDMIQSTAVCCLPKSFLLENEKPYIALLCCEQLSDKIRLSNKEYRARLYLLGFVKSSPQTLSIISTNAPLHTTVHGCQIQESTLLIQTRHIKSPLRFNELVEDYKPKGKREVSDSEDEEIQEDDDDTTAEIEDGLEDLVLMKDEPSVHIYVCNWDPPFGNDRAFMKTRNLMQDVITRVKTLVNVHLGARFQDKTPVDYQLTSLPINSKDCYKRDRMCKHFLLIAFCVPDELRDWYLNAESVALMNNLSKLMDVDDKILTLKNNEIQIAKEKFEVWEDFKDVLCRVERDRMTGIMDKACKNITFNDEDPEESQFFAIAQKCREIVKEAIQDSQQDEEQEESSDDE